MVGDNEIMKDTSKRTFTKVFGAIKPKPRDRRKRHSSSGTPNLVPSTTLSTPSTSSSIPKNSEDLDSSTRSSLSISNNPLYLSRKRSADDDRTMSRYSAAVKRLKDVVGSGRMNWEGFVPPNVDSIAESISQLQEELEKILSGWATPTRNRDLWSKGKHMMRQIFDATSPFVKHFLLVANCAAQVLILSRMLYADPISDPCFESLWSGSWRLDVIHNCLLDCVASDTDPLDC
jgi:hypothetical protein